MTYLFIIALMAILSAYSGGSLPGSQYLNKKGDKNPDGSDKGGVLPFNGTWIPELLFAVPFGVLSYKILIACGVWLPASILGGVAITARCYLWMQTGIGYVLGWGEPRPITADPNRHQTLTPVVDWLAAKLGITKTIGDAQNSPTINYCRLFMAVKGFLIGLPAGGVVLAVLWPLGYEIGARSRGRLGDLKSHMLTELTAGAGAGISIVVAWEIFKWLVL